MSTPTVDASESVNDNATFRRMMRFPYSRYSDFLEDFHKFQLETCSSYRIIMTTSAAKYFAQSGRKIADCFPYKFVKYVCVHVHEKRTVRKYKKHRFEDLDCQAFVRLIVVNDQLQPTGFSMVHNHSFHLGNPWMYYKNRRLNEEAQREVHQLLDQRTLGGRQIREYVSSKFGIKFTSIDFNNMRTRYLKQRAKEQQLVRDTSEPVGERVAEPDGSEIGDSIEPDCPAETSDASQPAVTTPSVRPLDVQPEAVTDQSKLSWASRIGRDLALVLGQMDDSQFQRHALALSNLIHLLSARPEITLHYLDPLSEQIKALCMASTQSDGASTTVDSLPSTETNPPRVITRATDCHQRFPITCIQQPLEPADSNTVRVTNTMRTYSIRARTAGSSSGRKNDNPRWLKQTLIGLENRTDQFQDVVLPVLSENSGLTSNETSTACPKSTDLIQNRFECEDALNTSLAMQHASLQFPSIPLDTCGPTTDLAIDRLSAQSRTNLTSQLAERIQPTGRFITLSNGTRANQVTKVKFVQTVSPSAPDLVTTTKSQPTSSSTTATVPKSRSVRIFSSS